jgi:hypothetical protein
VDPRLVRAMIAVESAYQLGAVSRKGAIGLMQLMPATARQYGVDFLDPQANIEAGVKHLRSLLDRFETSVALAAYNAGEAAVLRFGGIPPYRETRDHVRILSWRLANLFTLAILTPLRPKGRCVRCARAAKVGGWHIIRGRSQSDNVNRQDLRGPADI